MLQRPAPTSLQRPKPLSVLVLQGGGALGAYQAGVVEALQGAGVAPDWVTGISIGAVNAALIAGNPPERRLERLREFWDQATSGPFFSPLTRFDPWRSLMNQASAATAAAFGAPGFFTPRTPGPLFWPPGTPEAISYYDTAPLRSTLERLVDFDRINAGVTRLSVEAVNVRTGGSVVFDSARQRLTADHVMASGALPPGFPPVEIEGELYWDGGVVSNTPLQFVLDEEETRDLLVFQVDLFNAHGAVPRTLLEVDERERDIRYSSRTRLNTDASLRIHRMKAALRSLLDRLPDGFDAPEGDLALLEEAARETAVTVVQLIYRKAAYEGGSKDFEFSRQTMTEHWASGMADVRATLDRHPELFTTPPAEGVRVIDAGRAGGEVAPPRP